MSEPETEKSSVKYRSRGGTPLYYHLVDGSEKPVVIFIHNMWGNHKSCRRHVEFFNALGYTCVTFNLFRGSTIKNDHSYSTADYFQFIYSNWCKQITDVLDSIPGQKIVFSLSGPSLSGLIAATKRKDIAKYICDGGPFKEVWSCTYRMFTFEKKISNRFLRFLWTTWSILIWGPFAFKHLTRALEGWNPKVPILSIRGALDPIVHVNNIDNVFKSHNHLSLRIYKIDKGFHLDGLKNFSEDYSRVLISFLKGEMNIRY